MSEHVVREWKFYLDDMIEFAEKVMVYTDGLDQDEFVASGLNYDARVRDLELIGESATHIPDHVRASNTMASYHCYTQQAYSWLSLGSRMRRWFR